MGNILRTKRRAEKLWSRFAVSSGIDVVILEQFCVYYGVDKINEYTVFVSESFH